MDDFLSNLKDIIFFVGADKNTGFGKVIVKEVKENESDFFSVKSIIEKIKNSNFASDKEENFLFPPEVEKDNLFPFVLRKWDIEKGSGEKILYHQ